MIDNYESVLDYYTKNIPEYYPTMYLDGYSPMEILQANHKSFNKELAERNSHQETPINIRGEATLNGKKL